MKNKKIKIIFLIIFLFMILGLSKASYAGSIGKIKIEPIGETIIEEGNTITEGDKIKLTFDTDVTKSYSDAAGNQRN